MPQIHQLSHAALIGLRKTRGEFSVRPGPTFLEGVLWVLEMKKPLTCSQVLLRRELRKMSPEERQSVSRSLTGAGAR